MVTRSMSMPPIDDKRRKITVDGEPFACNCGCDTFKDVSYKDDRKTYECEQCGGRYESGVI